MTKKKVFFTCSSRAIKDKQPSIAYAIELIDKSNDLEISYRWFDNLGSIQDIRSIYEKNTKAILNSALVLADVSHSSTGVGQQIALGMFYKIPVLIMAQKKFKESIHSFFLKGTSSSQVSFYYYEDEKDLQKNLITFILSRLDDNFVKLNFIATKSIKRFLAQESTQRGVSQSELLRQIVNEWRELNP